MAKQRKVSIGGQCAIDLWKQKIAAEMSATRCDHATAVSRVAKRYPVLHEHYLLAANEGNPAAQASISRRFGH